MHFTYLQLSNYSFTNDYHQLKCWTLPNSFYSMLIKPSYVEYFCNLLISIHCWTVLHPSKAPVFFSSWVFFVTFSFWDIFDFVNGQPYTKSTIPQKLKVGKIWHEYKSFLEQCASFLKIWPLLNIIIFFICLFGIGPEYILIDLN